MRDKTFVIGLGILIIVILAFLGFYARSKPGTGTTGTVSPEVTAKLLEVTSADWTNGGDPKVTLVEYADFQCPACGAYHPLLKQLKSEYGNKVLFVYRQFPLTQIHINALLAGKAAEAAGMQNKFWEMHDMLYEKQTEWSEKADAKTIFLDYAGTLGLDKEKFSKDIELPEVNSKIQASYVAGEKLGVQGTPTFFLNGVKIPKNPSSVEEFKALIEAELNK